MMSEDALVAITRKHRAEAIEKLEKAAVGSRLEREFRRAIREYDDIIRRAEGKREKKEAEVATAPRGFRPIF